MRAKGSESFSLTRHNALILMIPFNQNQNSVYGLLCHAHRRPLHDNFIFWMQFARPLRILITVQVYN